MAPPSKKWIDAIHRAEGKYANWDPDTSIKVGDYGKRNSKTGEFQRMGNIYDNLEIRAEVREIQNFPPKEVEGSGPWVIQLGGVESLEEVDSDDQDVPPIFQAHWNFPRNEPGAVLVMPLGYSTTSIPKEMPEDKLTKVEQLNKMLLVTDVWSSRAYARYLSESSGSDLELSLNPVGREFEWRKVQNSGNYRDGCRKEGSELFTLLFKAKKLRPERRWPWKGKSAVQRAPRSTSPGPSDSAINRFLPSNMRISLADLKFRFHCPGLNTRSVNRPSFDFHKTENEILRGGFADVWKCYIPQKNIFVAVKVLHSDMAREGLTEEKHDKLLRRVRREISIWESLDHKNIAPLLGHCEEPEFRLFSPWYEHGDVRRYIREEQPDITIREQLIKGMVSGVKYLHENDLIHGDIKPDNVLVTDDFQAVIIDFGLSSAIGDGSELKSLGSSARKGNYRWLAPEIAIEEHPCKSKQSDVFAVGCVVLEILTGEQPFKELQTTASLLINWNRNKSPPATRSQYPTLDSRWWRIMEGCWQFEPGARPTIESLYEDIRSGEPAPIRPY